MRYLDPISLNTFGDELTKFHAHYSLEALFSAPIDHLAVKTKDAADYEAYRDSILPLCSMMTEADLHNRRIATAKLNKPIVFTNSAAEPIARISYLEIMEPRPEKVGKDLVGIDHCELVIKSHIQTLELLNNKGIKTNEGAGEKEYRQTIVVRLNDIGQELKLSSQPLSQILQREVDEGVAKILK